MYKIGIDLGGTNIAVGIVNENCQIIAKDSTPTKADRPYDEIVNDICLVVKRVLDNNGISLDEVSSIGFGSPGILDNEKGTVTDNSNIHWENYPIKEKIQKQINKPVYMGNDANVAAWAEYLGGAGRGSKNMIMLTLGTGIGGGIIIEGKLITGSHNIGAEIGHSLLVADGEQCGCGNKGCIEAYCSATALIKFAKRNLKDNPDSSLAKKEHINAKTVIDAAKAGDRYASEIFDDYTTNLARFLGSLINFLDPDIIVLGGGVANAGEFLLEPLRKKTPAYTVFPQLTNTNIVKAALGNDAGIIGAALLGE
ncbi:MAG: ROK family glucokinase [Clostridia bacterium]|nr:ROK family glucokinase [Clostridia bacterium]